MRKKILCPLTVLAAFSFPSLSPVAAPAGARAFQEYGKMPLVFVENQGQTDRRVAYYARGLDKGLYFTEEGLTYVLSAREAGAPQEEAGVRRETGPARRAPVRRHVVKLDFVGSSPIRPRGQERSSAVVSHFTGSPSDWKAGLPAYRKVVYSDLWPGIDLVYEGTANRLKYGFSVEPGADPSAILLAYRGAEVTVTDTGNLQVATSVSTFLDEKPAAYQDGREIPCRFDLKTSSGAGRTVYGFRLGPYDRARPVLIDPAVLVACGYVGGDGHDQATDIAVDGSGNAYIAGYTNSLPDTFPVQVGPDTSYNGSTYDAFVAKVNASGTALVYCGYIGGTGEDRAHAIAVDGLGNAYVAGLTFSSEATFPVRTGPGLTAYVGWGDAFVAKVNAAGTALDYCGFIAGFSGDHAEAIAVDDGGHAYVTGNTGSSAADLFPVTTGPDLSWNGGADAFVAKVEADGTGFVYCGYIGGDNFDRGYGIAVDRDGNAYVVGDARSTEGTFPVVVGPDLTQNGGYDGFVAKVSSSGDALTYCGYIGGSGDDHANTIRAGRGGVAHVAGYTGSTEATFPVLDGPDLTYNGGADDGFAAEVNGAGTALARCGYIGGSASDEVYGIALDGKGNVYVAGTTASGPDSFPVLVGPSLTHQGYTDAFVARISASGSPPGGLASIAVRLLLLE